MVHRTKATHFVGVARIALEHLDFGSKSGFRTETGFGNEHREESRKAKNRLLNVFRLDGCRRYDEENFVDASIDAETLASALSEMNITPHNFQTKAQTYISDPSSLLTLNLRRPIRCLNGLHRIQAAKDYLDRNDQWWVVRLYDGLDPDTSTTLIEGFAHEQCYSDGFIFLNIRRYHLARDVDGENRWWARLSSSKRKDLRQLLKQTELANAFDKLIKFPGLWPPIQLGTLHRQHGMKCTEGFVNCLDKVYEAWTAIVPEGLERYVDTVTVRSLELYAPGACKSDTTSVARVMKDRNRCFPGITNNEDRSEIVNRLLGIKYIIPSLRTFFENQKYLEPCCTILRQLFGESDQKHSLWRAFSANYIKPSELYVQHVEGRLSTVGISADGPTAMGLAYVTLWLFCMRHFPEMTSITPNLPKNADGHDQKQRKRTRFSENACGSHQSNPRKSPVKKRDFNPALWHKLGRLAVDLGLKTKEAEILAAQNPDIEHATRFLKLARPNWAEDRDDPSVQKVRQVLEDMKEEPRPPVTPILSTDDDPNWDDDQRCGKPREDDHEKDKSCLFLWLFAAGSGSGKHITSLYGKRDMLEGFLKPYLPEKNSDVARKVQELSLVSWEEEEPDDEMIGIGEYLNAGIGAPNVDYEPHRLQEPTEQRQEENEQLEVLLQECQQQPEDGKDQFAKQLADKEHYIDLLRQDLEDANHKLREKQDISSLRQELDMKNKDVIRATEDLAAARATISHQHEVEIALKKTADELNTLRQQIVQYEIEIKTLRQGSSQYEATIEAREKETAQTTKKTLEQRDQTIQELQNKSGHEEGILKQRDEKIQELERDNLCLKETNKVSQEERAKLQSTLKLREQQYQELEGKFKSLGETDTSNYNELRDTLKQTECALELRDQEIQELQTAILDLERNHESSHDDELQLQGDTNKSSRDETAKLQRTIEQRDQRIKDLESKLDSLELQNNVVGIERNKSNHDNEVQVQGTLEQRDQKIQEETAKLHSTLELREKRIEELQNQILDLKGQKKPGHNKEVQGTLELSGQKIQELQEIEKSSHDETAELQSTLEPRDQAVQKLESNVVSLEEANKAIYDENIKLQETLILRDRKIQDLESEFNSLHVSSCKEQLSLGRSIQTLQTDKKTLQTYEQTLQIEIQTLQTNLEASRIELVQLSHHHEMDIGHDFVEDPVDTAAARFATQSQYEQERDVEKIKGVIKGVTKGVVKDLSESVRICYIAEYGLCGFQTMTYKFKSFVNPVQIMEKFLPVWHRHALQVCVVELAWQDGQDSIRSCKVVTDSDPQALVDICQSRGGCIIGRAEVMERFRTEVIRISERQRKRKRYILDLENGRDSRNTKKQQHREIRKPVKPVGFALNSKGEPEPEAGEEQDQAVRTSNEMVT